MKQDTEDLLNRGGSPPIYWSFPKYNPPEHNPLKKEEENLNDTDIDERAAIDSLSSEIDIEFPDPAQYLIGFVAYSDI